MGYSATVECEAAPYARALCWYDAGDVDRAEAGLRQVVEEGREGPEMLKAIYFLARTKMRKEEWSEASRLLVELFGLSPSFYRDWNGDFLLGVCRDEQGRD